MTGGQFSTIDFPGATFSGATGIDQRRNILGRYRNADGVTHGFLLTGFRRACAIFVPQIVGTASGAAVTHSSDFTLVTASRPATAGEVLSLSRQASVRRAPALIRASRFRPVPRPPSVLPLR